MKFNFERFKIYNISLWGKFYKFGESKLSSHLFIPLLVGEIENLYLSDFKKLKFIPRLLKKKNKNIILKANKANLMNDYAINDFEIFTTVHTITTIIRQTNC